MSRYVVDASVAAKWFIPEVHSDAALRLFEGDHSLAVPDLFLAEFGNILWKKTRLGDITRDEGREILKAIKIVPFDIVSSAPLLDPAFEIAVGLGRTMYDSVYIALAVLEGCPLVTADRALCRVIKTTPFAQNVLWIEEC
ncbi:MAG: type II toxin-antitoxin system VapC family toxin [Nitrospirota bacterium]